MSEVPRTISTESEMCELLYDTVSHRVEEDLQDQMQELRREINELRVVVYALLAAGFIAIFMAGGLSFGQAVVALAGCFVAFAAYGWARDKIADWRAG